MYPLGILFGLGFDTSSEIALLGISSIEATRQNNFWVMLIFPILFTGNTPLMYAYNWVMLTSHTAGMCLIDTTDGALMLSLYIQPATNFLPPTKERETDPEANTETTRLSTLEDGIDTQPATTTVLDGTDSNKRDPIAFLYYSIVLTTLTVMVALVIGIIQVLSLVLNVTDATGRFWDGVQTASDYYDAIGGGICGCFVVVGLSSVACYKPWRRWAGVDVDAGCALDSHINPRQEEHGNTKELRAEPGQSTSTAQALVQEDMKTGPRVLTD